MLRSAAIARNPRRAQVARTKSVPAPVGGLNDRDPQASMPESDAIILTNFFPKPAKVILRKGSAAWVTGIGSQVETLMGYRPPSGISALFGAAGAAIYNVTTSGAVGAAVVSGLANARWQHVNMSN